MLPADEDYAMGLLTIFSAHARAARTEPARQRSEPRIRLPQSRPPLSIIDAAVAYSEDRGWLRRECGWLRLTGGGYAEM